MRGAHHSAETVHLPGHRSSNSPLSSLGIELCVTPEPSEVIRRMNAKMSFALPFATWPYNVLSEMGAQSFAPESPPIRQPPIRQLLLVQLLKNG